MSGDAEPWLPLHPWDVVAMAASDLPDDKLLCDTCLQPGPGLTIWQDRQGEVLMSLHGRCMDLPGPILDELAARRVK